MQISEKMQELEWTGERLVTSLENTVGVVEHLHRYALAQHWVRNKTVLDIASGEGYGSYLLSQSALQVTGVDIDSASVEHAQNKYGKLVQNLSFQQGEVIKLPQGMEKVDRIVSFETIEHLAEQDEMLISLKSMLNPGGMLILSTPERDLYRRREPANPFHVKELSFDEFKELLQRHFRFCSFFDQRFVFGSVISPKNNGIGEAQVTYYSGDYYKVNATAGDDPFYHQPYFNLAVCSDEPLESLELFPSVFIASDILRQEKEKAGRKIAELMNWKRKVMADPVHRAWFWLKGKIKGK
jgi:ubiquinone/menaquinone biosynthesis C-methylase UbiE